MFDENLNTITGPFSIKELEKNSVINSFGEINWNRNIFDEKNNAWLAFKKKLKKGDEFYSEKIKLSSNSFSYNTILVREGCIFDRLNHHFEVHSETLID